MGGEGPAHAPGGPAGLERRQAGALEAEILGILRAADSPLSPGEVRQRLAAGQGGSQGEGVGQGGGQGGGQGVGQGGGQGGGQRGELSYSTVVTIVTRLHAKGLLARQRAGRGFAYTPLDDASLAASRMSQVLGSENDHDAVLSRFVSGLSSRDARLLRELLAGDPDLAARDGGRPGPGPGREAG